MHLTPAEFNDLLERVHHATADLPPAGLANVDVALDRLYTAYIEARAEIERLQHHAGLFERLREVSAQ